jgi:hypothetical protein
MELRESVAGIESLSLGYEKPWAGGGVIIGVTPWNQGIETIIASLLKNEDHLSSLGIAPA